MCRNQKHYENRFLRGLKISYAMYRNRKKIDTGKIFRTIIACFVT